MGHTVFIVLHATFATVAWVSGIVTLPAGRFFEVFRWSQLAMAGVLVPAVAIGWAGLDAGSKIAYSVLLALAVVMVTRGEFARRCPTARTGGVTARFLDHVGFTIISLSDGFAIVALLRAGAPGWLVAAVAVAVVVTGHFALRAAKARFVRPARSAAQGPGKVLVRGR